MLGLIGRKADGWIAPLATGYETKPAAQDRIDAGTIAAARTNADHGSLVSGLPQVLGVPVGQTNHRRAIMKRGRQSFEKLCLPRTE